MNSYKTVKELAEFRFEDRKSVFIGYCKPVSDESEATDFIASVKKKYPDARHWVYAYVLRENSTMRYTDDREPQGTAGMPVLDALRKNGATDAVIVVVRYFGGILLGTGGLVHAYSETALGALRAAKMITYNTYAYAMITVNYSDYQKIGGVLTDLGFVADDVDYSDVVCVSGSVIADEYDNLCQKISELTSARAEISFIEKKYSYRE